MIEVIDIGLSSIGSVKNAFQELTNFNVKVISRADQSRSPRVFVLPGNGNFGEASLRLEREGFKELLVEHVNTDKGKLIGICLGMQLLGNGSDESPEHLGLGFADMHAQKLIRAKDEDTNPPNIGWSELSRVGDSFSELPLMRSVFFSHSFAFIKPKLIPSGLGLLTSHFGSHEFVAAMRNEHILGFQFHPEKSSLYGSILLQSSLKWAGLD